MYRNPVDHALDSGSICAVYSNRKLISLFYVRDGSTCIFGIRADIHKCYVICVRKRGIKFDIEFCNSIWRNPNFIRCPAELYTVRPIRQICIIQINKKKGMIL